MQRTLQIGYGFQSRKLVLDSRDWSLDVQFHKGYSDMFFFSGVDIMSKSDVRGVWTTKLQYKGTVKCP